MRGKAEHVWDWGSKPGDHPRLCGEKDLNSQSLDAFIGSPPPMRGKAVISVNRFMVIGITPAYAGKSQSVGY